MASRVRRISLGQFAPSRPGAQDLPDALEHRSYVLPRTTSALGASFGSQGWFDELPLGIARFPSSSHAPSACFPLRRKQLNRFNHY
jgi:hypothetical protein